MGHRVHIFFPKTDGERAVVEAMRREGTLAVGSAMTSALLGKPREADCDEEWVGDVDCEDGLGGDIEKAFNKDQPRDERGRFSHVGSAKASAELKRRYKPSDLVAARKLDMTLTENLRATSMARDVATQVRSKEAADYQAAYDAGYKEAAKIRRQLLAKEYAAKKSIERAKAKRDALSVEHNNAMNAVAQEFSKFWAAAKEKNPDVKGGAVFEAWKNSAEYNAAYAAVAKIKPKIDKAHQKVIQLEDSLRERVMSALAVPVELRAGVSHSLAKGDAVKAMKLRMRREDAASIKAANPKELGAKAEESRKFLDSLLSKDAGNENAKRIQVFGINEKYDQRGFSAAEGIFVSKHSETTTYVHEMGHVLEHSPSFASLARGFLNKRCGDETPHVMRRDDDGRPEWGREDDFAKAFGDRGSYVGKMYGTRDNAPTEVFSMGLQKLYEDPVGFAKKDPEYFNFIVGTMRGHIKSPAMVV